MKQENNTHETVVGYVLWIFGFMGAHRFYFGKKITGIIWLFTFGLLGIGWIVDLFLIPRMRRQADNKYTPGPTSYSLAWVLLVIAGAFGLHRFYQDKIGTGILYLCTLGVFGFGVIYDYLTLNEQIDQANKGVTTVRQAPVPLAP